MILMILEIVFLIGRYKYLYCNMKINFFGLCVRYKSLGIFYRFVPHFCSNIQQPVIGLQVGCAFAGGINFKIMYKKIILEN